MIIAIDGPAGAGKSTVARALAARLGFAFLDTGALYRATALATMRAGIPAAELVGELEIRLGDRVLLNGVDVTSEIRTPEVTDTTHRIATDPSVRLALTEKQRQIIHLGNWVAEGRDIGTVVAPDAEIKVFLSASLEERARRRASESGADLEAVMSQLAERDTRDEEREHAPLVAAADAIHMDSSFLTADDIVEQIAELVPADKRRPQALFAATPDDAEQGSPQREKRRSMRSAEQGGTAAANLF